MTSASFDYLFISESYPSRRRIFPFLRLSAPVPDLKTHLARTPLFPACLLLCHLPSSISCLVSLPVTVSVVSLASIRSFALGDVRRRTINRAKFAGILGPGLSSGLFAFHRGSQPAAHSCLPSWALFTVQPHRQTVAHIISRTTLLLSASHKPSTTIDH